MQQTTTRMSEEARRVGLKISTTKTKVMKINARHDEIIHIDIKEIEDMDKLVCLGARVSKKVVACRT